MAKFCTECGAALQENAQFCIQCGTAVGSQQSGEKWSGKKDRVLGRDRRKTIRLKRFWPLGIVVLMAGWIYLSLPESGNPIVTESPSVAGPVYYSQAGEQMTNIQVAVKDGELVIPLDLVREKRFVRFMYGDADAGLPLLAYITNDGKVVTAVSMCEPCNSTRFHMKGKDLVCNSCGSTWDLNSLEAISGSCSKYPPDALPNTVLGNEIHINQQAVMQWRRRI